MKDTESEPTPQFVLAKRGLQDLHRSGSYRIYHRKVEEKLPNEDLTISGFVEVVYDLPLKLEDLFPDYAEFVLLHLPVPTSASVYAEIVGENQIALKFIQVGSTALN